ncbi:MAG: hypothetical protein SOY42_07320 [Clostridium sp.]|nr:hypothetical protein [Clostridium sp.]
MKLLKKIYNKKEDIFKLQVIISSLMCVIVYIIGLLREEYYTFVWAIPISMLLPEDIILYYNNKNKKYIFKLMIKVLLIVLALIE